MYFAHLNYESAALPFTEACSQRLAAYHHHGLTTELAEDMLRRLMTKFATNIANWKRDVVNDMIVSPPLTQRCQTSANLL